jgi:hypothetical protein
VQNTIKRITKSVRLKSWMRENNIDSSDDNYIPSLYIPMTWKPPQAPVVIKNAITNFS